MNPMPFAVESSEQSNVHVIAVQGELDLHTAAQLEETVDAALANGNRRLAMDLSACEFIDSTGLALIVRAWRQLDTSSDGAAGGRFALCGLSDQVRRLFQITGLGSLISTHETLDDALGDLNR